MKLKFKRFIKRFLIVTVISVFLFCSLTFSSSAYTIDGTDNREYSNFHFLSFSFYHLTSTENGSDVWTIIDDNEIANVSYRLVFNNWLGVYFTFNDSIFVPEDSYHVSLCFSPIGNNAISDHVYYGSFYSSISRYGSFTINEDTISSYRLGLDDKNEAVIDYAYTGGSEFPTIFSDYSLSNSSKVFYHTYFLNYDFVFHSGDGSSSNTVAFYFYDFNFDSIPFDTFQLQYGWDSPVPPPSSGALDDMTSLEDSIIGGTSEGRQNTIDLFSNFSLVPWLRKGFLATTHIFNLFADIPALNEILNFSLTFGSFAFIVGMSISLLTKR